MNYMSFPEFANAMNAVDAAGTVGAVGADDSNKSVNFDTNVKELLGCYSTFLVSRKYSIEKIKQHRMEAIISNYIQLYDINENYEKGSFDKNLLRKFYKANIVDSFDKKLNPPKCFFAEARRERIATEIADKRERDMDDIADHYKSINDKYKYMHTVSQQAQQNSNQSNGKNEDESEILSEHNYYDYEEDCSRSSYNSDYYYDDYFSDTGSDYNSD